MIGHQLARSPAFWLAVIGAGVLLLRRRAIIAAIEAATENPNVLDEPSPTVIFETFGDNALGLLLRCFVDSIDLRVSTISALNEAINDKFNAAGISIAFPQRDLHLDTIKPLRVQIEHAGPTNE